MDKVDLERDEKVKFGHGGGMGAMGWRSGSGCKSRRGEVRGR